MENWKPGLKKSLDSNDAIFFLSAGVVGWGLWQISPATAAIIVGGLFLVLSLYGRFAKKEK